MSGSPGEVGAETRAKDTFYGGWVADPTASSARATDEMTGRTLNDAVENGVVLFMYEGDFSLMGDCSCSTQKGKSSRPAPCAVDPDAVPRQINVLTCLLCR